MEPGLVVADAGPLHYLILVDGAEALEVLFERVLVPGAVRDELNHPKAPEKVKDWIKRDRRWLEFHSLENPTPVRGIHKGEAEVLQLALQANAKAVLMDDLDGREAARKVGVAPIGTIALLELAAARNLLELPQVVEALRNTNFFVREELLEAALERDWKRRSE
jgi:predicted nucleic acid-binding protein